MHAYSYPGDRVRTYALLTFLSILAAIGLTAAADRIHLGPPWLISAPTVGAVFATLYELLDRWAWRLRLLRACGVANTPVVSGRYAGTLTSIWAGGTTVPITVDIEQTWNRIVVRLTVDGPQQTSSSISLAAALIDTGQQQARLTYMYRNSVRPGFAATDMSDHDGTAELVFDAGQAHVIGRYYNYRGRQGTIDLQRQ